jgi:hypothetical protein
LQRNAKTHANFTTPVRWALAYTRRKHMKLILSITLSTITMVADASNCTTTKYADFEFIGTVTEYESSTDRKTNTTRKSATSFSVIKWETVSTREEITVYGSNSKNCGCHYDFKVGKTYRVFGEYIGGKSFTYYCSGIKEISFPNQS